MLQGVSYVQISGLVEYIRKYNTHRAMTTPPVVLVLSGRAICRKSYRCERAGVVLKLGAPALSEGYPYSSLTSIGSIRGPMFLI
jgi:hypothetical protein